MTEKNNLKSILVAAGFKNIQPTDKLLTELGFTSRGFYKFYHNRNKTPISATQREKLDNWLEDKLGLEKVSISPLPKTKKKKS